MAALVHPFHSLLFCVPRVFGKKLDVNTHLHLVNFQSFRLAQPEREDCKSPGLSAMSKGSCQPQQEAPRRADGIAGEEAAEIDDIQDIVQILTIDL